jgi:hypothetical protein
MKAIRITSAAVLSLLLGIAAPAYAQQEQHGEKQDHPEQQQGRHEQGRPEQQRAQQQRQSGQRQQQPQRAQQPQRQDQHNQQERPQQQWSNEPPRRTQEQQRVEQSAWQQHRARTWESEHRTWQQRGGYRGYRIPDDRFRGYFGPDHGFRIQGRPFLVVGGYPRFQYEGYWISAVDPWPEYWGNDWYDTDDVYVNYADNGYYMYNRKYPTAPGIAISISF